MSTFDPTTFNPAVAAYQKKMIAESNYNTSGNSPVVIEDNRAVENAPARNFLTPEQKEKQKEKRRAKYAETKALKKAARNPTIDLTGEDDDDEKSVVVGTNQNPLDEGLQRNPKRKTVGGLRPKKAKKALLSEAKSEKTKREASGAIKLWSLCVREISSQEKIKPPIKKGTAVYDKIQKLYQERKKDLKPEPKVAPAPVAREILSDSPSNSPNDSPPSSPVSSPLHDDNNF